MKRGREYNSIKMDVGYILMVELFIFDKMKEGEDELEMFFLKEKLYFFSNKKFL